MRAAHRSNTFVHRATPRPKGTLRAQLYSVFHIIAHFFAKCKWIFEGGISFAWGVGWTVEDAGPYKVSFVVGRVHGVPPYGLVERVVYKCRWRFPHPSRQSRATFPAGEGLYSTIPPRLCTHYESALTHASLVYGVPRNERSRVLGVRVRGGGEPASRRDCFKGKVTFPSDRREQAPALR